jgi:hypothetical protein
MKNKIKIILRESVDVDKAIEIQAPNKFENKKGYTSVFLAGSIGGVKKKWQSEVIKELSHKPYIFLNPFRDDYAKDLEQSIDNPQFYEQVNWELDMLEKADKIIVYFDPETDAPITLLEFGKYASSGKLIVCCPKGFWRKGNVDIVCKRENIKQVDTLEELIKTLDKNE